MSDRTDKEFLEDVQEAIRRIRAYVTGMTAGTFLTDIKTQDAVIRNLEIIGEATKNLSEAIRAKHPEVPWKSMAGVRDRLIHHYFGVNFDIVWQIVTMELPQMASLLEGIAGDEETGG
jgi:uncharacterized protein with HEPN domain